MNTNKTVSSFLSIGLATILSGCTTLDESNKLETLCDSSIKKEICANLDIQDLDCLGTRTELIMHRIEEYQAGVTSAQSSEKEITLLVNHRLCLEESFNEMPIFQTAKRNVIKEELIKTKEHVLKLKDDLEFLRAKTPGKRRILVS